MANDIDTILKDNERRTALYDSTGFDPYTGAGAPGPRKSFRCKGMPWPEMQLPVDMHKEPLVAELAAAESLTAYLKTAPERKSKARRDTLLKEFTRLRCKYDFPFFAAFAVKIKNKFGGGNIPFVLTYPQLKLLTVLEEMRNSNTPIRIILLKARQWGGSTLTQIYMSWIQLFWRTGFYSAIVAHQSKAAYNIRAMFARMIHSLPPWLLDLSCSAPLELKPYERSPSDVTVTQSGKTVRDIVINVGSMESPDSIRSSDVALAHYSEVAYWRKTDAKEPSDVIRSVSSSILYVPLTMEVEESTANGEGGFFYEEWKAATAGQSRRRPVFVAWYEITQYRVAFDSAKHRRTFAKWLYEHRFDKQAASSREEPGSYLWYLWSAGATLEGINWYVITRSNFETHDKMASEYPSDPDDAFASSGGIVFQRSDTARLEESCMPPLETGEVTGPPIGSGRELQDLQFAQRPDGQLKVWDHPDRTIDCRNRYLVTVDIGGRSAGADWSDILVIDRYWTIYGDKPAIVAEWHGHIRHDWLAWKAAQIAAYYCNALLVIESNTIESKDNDQDNDHSLFILNQIGDAYPNLYQRESPPDKISGKPTKTYGFHTNVSTKKLVIDNLTRYVEDNAYIERESEAITELNVYRKVDGRYEAAQGYHDDRVMVRAIGLYIHENMPPVTTIEPNRKFNLDRPLGESTI